MERKIEELSKAFNEGLLDNQTETSDESSDNNDDDDNNDADVQLYAQASPDDSSLYFTSQEWQIKLTSITNAYHSVKQPNEPSSIQRLLQPVCRSPHNTQTSPLPATDNKSRPGTQKSRFPTLNISIPPTIHFPQRLSQSTIVRRNGSNGCTWIALTVAKLFYSFPPNNIDKSLQLNQSLAYLTVSGILIGNQHYEWI